MLHRCKTEGCENYDILVEVNKNEEGEIVFGARMICDKCGNPRVIDEEANRNTPSFSIDELALGTKRMFDKPKN